MFSVRYHPMMMRRLAGAIALSFAIAVSSLGAAEEAAPEEPAPPTPAGPSTIQGLVEDVSLQAGRLWAELPRGELDLAVVLRSNLQGEGGAALTASIGQLLTGAVSRSQGFRSVATPELAPGGTVPQVRAAAGAGGFEQLLLVNLSVVDNHLVLEGVLFETAQHLW